MHDTYLGAGEAENGVDIGVEISKGLLDGHKALGGLGGLVE